LVPLQNCFDYTSIPQSGCSAKFAQTAARALARATERPKPKSRAEDQLHDQSGGEQHTGADGSQPGAAQPPVDAGSGGGPGTEQQAPGATAPDAAGEAGPTEHPGNGAGPQAGAAATRTLLEFLLGDEGRPGQ
jgi:hypothetical protein